LDARSSGRRRDLECRLQIHDTLSSQRFDPASTPARYGAQGCSRCPDANGLSGHKFLSGS
jgi:hypothetical protein